MGGGDNTESSKTVKNLYALGFITSPCVLSVCATTTNRLRCDATLNPFTCCSFPSPAAAGCNCDLISAEIPVHYCSVVSVSWGKPSFTTACHAFNSQKLDGGTVWRPGDFAIHQHFPTHQITMNDNSDWLKKRNQNDILSQSVVLYVKNKGEKDNVKSNQETRKYK